jgi:hypothetical protein
MRKDEENKNSKPIQGFNMSGGLEERNTKSTRDLESNKIKAQGKIMAIKISAVVFMISLTIGFDSVMRFIIPPRFHKDMALTLFLEHCVIFTLFALPSVFFYRTWYAALILLVGWPIFTIVFNPFRHFVMSEDLKWFHDYVAQHSFLSFFYVFSLFVFCPAFR